MLHISRYNRHRTKNFSENIHRSSDSNPEENIQGLIKYYLIIGLCSFILYWITWCTWLISAERQVRKIRYIKCLIKFKTITKPTIVVDQFCSFALFENILRQDIGWFDQTSVGELTNRLNHDLSKIVNT